MPKHIKKFHKEIKAFKCNICEYETAQKIHLKRHIENVHEGIKPFKCKNCDYETALNEDLKRHVDAVHNGFKPFKCHICQYETATKAHLKRHIISVHEKKKNGKYNYKIKNISMKYSQTSINIANMSKSAREIYEASLGISNAVDVNKEKGTKFCDITIQGVIFPSIKVEHSTIEQDKTSDVADPLLIHKFKEEIFVNNEATPIQDLNEVYIKQEEFCASGYQNEQENGMSDQEIKEEFNVGE